MNRYQQKIKEEAKKVYEKCADAFRTDKGEHGGASPSPNLSLWLDSNGILARHVEEIAKNWTKKDVLWVNENTRHRITYGDPQDNAFGAFYKDILSELKKLIKKT